MSQKPEKPAADDLPLPAENPLEAIPARTPFPIVGIGASAGGLEAFTVLLKHLPENTGMAFVVVQHLDPAHSSQLTALLARSTKMPVHEVRDGMVVQPNQIFVIPPNANLGIDRQKLILTPRGDATIPHPVDHFFRSLAREQQSWAIGVVLSGTGTDGAAGLEEIKGAGGITFAQDEKTAKFSGMPLEAAAGVVDFILPPEQIARELARIGHDPNLNLPAKVEDGLKTPDGAKNFRRILAILHLHTGLDFTQYRDTTIKRRIQRRMVVNNRHQPGDYVSHLENDGGEVKALFEDVLINVTSFFREPEMFEALKTQVFPELIKNSPTAIRIWVPACSTGQEAYSMAIALLEFLEHHPKPPAIQIFATDVNESVAIEKARRGFYPETIEHEVSPERLRRHFTREEKGYRINKSIRDLCIFARQNLIADPPFSRMGLISCRNVLIYFTPELQRRVVSMFHYGINPTGFLVLGGSETVGANSDLFELQDRKFKIFAKKKTAIRPFTHMSAEDLRPAPPATTQAKASYSPGSLEFQREADRILLGRFAPAAVLVNSNLEVLQFRGRTSLYLDLPVGEASFNVLKMARENLPLELGSAIQEARRTNAVVRRSARLLDHDQIRNINLEVLPVRLPGSSESCLLVLFEEADQNPAVDKTAARKKAPVRRPAGEKDRELEQLRTDLSAAREYLQAIVEQHDAANEELKCANEEVLSSNEELQSTNEQLGTAKEELQSTNEELVTLNEELHTRNTELNQLNGELRLAHEKLLDYVNVIVDTVRSPLLVLRADLRVHLANDSFCQCFQIPRNETEQRLVYDLCRGQWDLPELRRILTEVLTQKPVLKDMEAVFNFSQGSPRTMRINARRLEFKADATQMILLSIQDITEFNEIKTANQWLAAIVESSDDAIIGEDLDGQIVSWNQGATRFYGYAPGEIIGQPVSILLLPERPDEEFKILERIRRGEHVEHYETIRRRKDGRLLDVSLTVSPVKNAEGGIIGASKITRDITAAKRAEAAVRESEAREKTARLAAEAASRAKDDFLAALSHELRTPLNPVLLVASNAAKNPDLPPGVRTDFDMIRKNVELEARLIEDLLDLTRITHGKLSLDFCIANAHAILNDAIEAVRQDLNQKEITLALNLEAKCDVVRCDTVRLQQVFWNVLKNAVKFTPQQGRITIGTAGAADGETLTITVADTGIGMTPEELQRAFYSFSQGGESSRFGGLGLGLAISLKLVEFHAGRITAASAGRGCGATFTIELPLSRLAEDPAAAEAGRAAGSPEPGLAKNAGARILLVEDHEPTRNALTYLLISRKFKVSAAGSMTEALKIAAEQKIDFVISDIGLPDGNGNHLMTELHQRYGLKGIALTGYGMDQDVSRSLAAGFIAHLTKPVGIQALEKIFSITDLKLPQR